MKTGIYKIVNIVNNKSYVGSSVNINKRWREHKYELSRNIHSNTHLQRSWNKYGAENFKHEILLTCLRKDLIRLEQYCIDNYKPEYNILKAAGSRLGIPASLQTKLKISKSASGKKHLIKTKILISLSQHKKVYKICPKTDKVLEEYFSVKDASNKNNLSRSGISRTACKKSKTCGGFKWKY